MINQRIHRLIVHAPDSAIKKENCKFEDGANQEK